ncbi:MAG: hypothetical protein R3C24_08400 [Cyanobacteriota/Melainabacteria group bacterium]
MTTSPLPSIEADPTRESGTYAFCYLADFHRNTVLLFEYDVADIFYAFNKTDTADDDLFSARTIKLPPALTLLAASAWGDFEGDTITFREPAVRRILDTV